MNELKKKPPKNREIDLTDFFKILNLISRKNIFIEFTRGIY